MNAPIIQVSTDYSMFKFYSENRPVRDYKNLRKSISDLNLTPFTPIIVDDSFWIIDGQHRFSVCRELGLPIYFLVMSPDIDTSIAIQKLQEHQSWRQEEYLHYHATRRGGCYLELEQFEKTWKFGISNSAVIYPAKAINARVIREGRLHFDKNPLADSIALFLTCGEVTALRYGRTRPFVLAVRKAFEQYNPRQLEKIKQRLVTIPRCADYKQYLTAFENIVGKR